MSVYTEIDEWTDRADTRVEMAISETAKQLEYEANALWKGKRIRGETQLGQAQTLFDGPVHRVAVSYSEYGHGSFTHVWFYVMVALPEGEGEVEMYVRDPRFPDEVTP